MLADPRYSKVNTRGKPLKVPHFGTFALKCQTYGGSLCLTQGANLHSPLVPVGFLLVTEDKLQEVQVHALKSTQWFRSTIADLVIESNSNGEIVHFSFSYRRRRENLSIEWDGFHLKSFQIDEGEQDPTFNRSPLILAEMETPVNEALVVFCKVADQLEPKIFDFVSSKLSLRGKSL